MAETGQTSRGDGFHGSLSLSLIPSFPGIRGDLAREGTSHKQADILYPLECVVAGGGVPELSAVVHGIMCECSRVQLGPLTPSLVSVVCRWQDRPRAWGTQLETEDSPLLK